MFFVYVLISRKDQKLYIGFTDDVERRLAQHAEGVVESTKHRRPLMLIYYEAYVDKRDAQGREKFSSPHQSAGESRSDTSALGEEEKELLNLFDKALLTTDEAVERGNRSTASTLTLLTRLELKGALRKRLDGRYERVAKAKERV